MTSISFRIGRWSDGSQLLLDFLNKQLHEINIHSEAGCDCFVDLKLTFVGREPVASHGENKLRAGQGNIEEPVDYSLSISRDVDNGGRGVLRRYGHDGSSVTSAVFNFLGDASPILPSESKKV